MNGHSLLNGHSAIAAVEVEYAASEEAFRELRRRLVAEGASDGVVTHMGAIIIFTFTDPDQGSHEVVWIKPDVAIEAGLKRSDWTTVEME